MPVNGEIEAQKGGAKTMSRKRGVKKKGKIPSLLYSNKGEGGTFII